MLVRVASLILIAIPSAASAQSMNAEQFFKKAMALKKKGPMALMSRDLNPIVAEAKAAGLETDHRRRGG